MKHARIPLCLLAITALPARAVELEKTASSRSIKTTASADLASTNISRGTTGNKNAVLQPALRIKSEGLTVGTWGNFALDPVAGEIEKEVDGFVIYELPTTFATFAASYTEAFYPDSDLKNDQEVMVKATVNSLLNPYLVGYRGVGGVILNRDYYELGMNQQVFAAKGVTTSLGAKLGYIDRATGEDGINHVTLAAGAAYKFLTLGINYVIETDKKVNDLDQQERLAVVTGANYSF